jgi:hypothetical protein
MVGKSPTSSNTGQKWGTRAMMAGTNLYICAPTGCGFVANNWRSTYCRMPPLA